MYIIIHKYQRWPVNVETKRRYLKKYPYGETKSNISKYGLWVKRTVDLKPVQIPLGGACLQIKALS